MLNFPQAVKLKGHAQPNHTPVYKTLSFSMHLDTSTYYSAMCHGLRSPSLLSDSDDLAFLSFDSPTSPDTPSGKAIFPPTTSPTVYDLWLASREVPAKTGGYFVPGNQRPLNLANARLAYALSHQCVWKLVSWPILDPPPHSLDWEIVQSTMGTETRMCVVHDCSPNCPEFVSSLPRILPCRLVYFRW